MVANEEWSYPIAFHFSVTVGNLSESFQVVEGMTTSMDFEEVKSGGDNSRSFFLPKHRKNEDLVLKKGFLKTNSPIYTWCRKTFNSLFSDMKIETQTIVVSLLDEMNNPLMSWKFMDAYPYKWSLGTFDAMKNEIVIESISLKYQHMTEV